MFFFQFNYQARRIFFNELIANARGMPIPLGLQVSASFGNLIAFLSCGYNADLV